MKFTISFTSHHGHFCYQRYSFQARLSRRSTVRVVRKPRRRQRFDRRFLAGDRERSGRELSFTAITTFASGGVSSSTGAYDRLAQNSPLLGTWKQTGANRFDRTVYFFQFDPLGVPLRMLKNEEVYHLKRRNQFEGEGRQYACDLDGENCVDQNTPFDFTGRFVPAVVESDR